jgi:DNA-binding CsgD family transcriptional regulator
VTFETATKSPENGRHGRLRVRVFSRVGSSKVPCLVDLRGRLSNPEIRESMMILNQLVDGLKPGVDRPARPPQPHRRRLVDRRLSERQLDELVAAYQAGSTVYDLAERFKIHRQTVSQHLHRLGVTMRNQGLDDHEVNQAAVLYRQGCSLARTAERYCVDPSTVWRTFQARGIRMRDTHGRAQ